MRIDKFLWCVRVYKTRSIASEEIGKNRISINGNTAKQSKDVIPGDVIQVKKNQIIYTYRVTQIPKSRLGAKLVGEYIQDRTDPAELEKLKLKQLERNMYRENDGKPTRKDRQEIQAFVSGNTDWDEFFDDDDDDDEKEPTSDDETWDDMFEDEDDK